MEQDTIQQKTISAFVRVTGRAPSDFATPFKNLAGWDSLKFAELVIALQKELGSPLTTQEIVSCQCAQDLSLAYQNKL